MKRQTYDRPEPIRKPAPAIRIRGRGTGSLRFWDWFLGWLVAIGASLALGCDTGPPKTIPVTGRVTLEGGDWPRQGMIYFAPVEPAAGYSRRPGQADFDASGQFQAYTFEKGDGLIPGKYRMSIECWEVPPSMSPPSPGKSAVPPQYQSAASSGLTVDVPPVRGEAVELTLDLVSGDGESRQ